MLAGEEEEFFEDVLAILTLPEEGTKVVVICKDKTEYREFIARLDYKFPREIEGLKAGYAPYQVSGGIELGFIEFREKETYRGDYLIYLRGTK